MRFLPTIALEFLGAFLARPSDRERSIGHAGILSSKSSPCGLHGLVVRLENACALYGALP
jgi:hypothetical protein